MKSLLIPILFYTLSLQAISLPEAKEDVFAKFKRFNTSDGLSHNYVTDIIQDNKGYLWLATANGLNKFDGHTFRTYYPDSLSFLPSAVILDLEVDKYFRLWIATREGLCVYQREEDRFLNVESFLKEGVSLPDNHIRSIIADGDLLWAHTLKGFLLKINTKTKDLHYWKNAPCYQEYYLYDALYKAPDNLIYYGGRQCGPFIFDAENNTSRSCNNEARGISGVSDFYQDKDSILWMTAIDGIYTLNRSTKRFERLIHGSAFRIMEDADHHLWFATGNGLWHYNKEENKMIAYRHHEGVERTVSSNHVNCIYRDKAGNMWVGTNAGLNLFLPENEWLTHLDHQAALKKSLSSNRITAAIQLNDGEIWLGTKSRGINAFDPQHLGIKHIGTEGEEHKSIASMAISDFYEGEKGNVWIGLWSGMGFYKYNKKNKSYQLIAQDPSSTAMDWYNDFVDSDDGDLWVATWGGYGLCKLDKESLKMPSSRDANPYVKLLPSRLNTCLEKGRNKNLYIGTTDTGMFVLNESTNELEVYKEAFPEENMLWGTPVNDMYLDTNDKLWVGTHILNCFDTRTKTFSHHLISDEFRNLHIRRIISGKDSKLWLATNIGIIVFDVNSKEHIILSTSNKLPFNDFSKAAINLKDGRMLFGGSQGALIFDPDEILNYNVPPRCIQVTRITEFNDILYHDATITGTFSFDHHNKHLTFHLADLGGFCQSDRQYEYRLVGFHNEWLEAEKNQRSITISNLKHGRYELHIRERNTKNSLATFTIIKTPAFWDTLIFWVLIVFLVVGLAFLYFMIQHQRVLAENKALLAQQRLLRSQMNPHFTFNAINAIQNDVLKKPPIEAVKNLSKFASLIRQFLDSTRRDYVELSVENKLLKNYLDLQQLRYSHSFDYTIEVDDKIDVDLTLIPPLLSQSLLENAIEHGLKQLKSDGFVHLHYALGDGVVIVTIEDNGIGINRSVENEIHQHSSFAMEATRERLKILHKKNKKLYLFEIIDKSDLNLYERGTIVKYSIPFVEQY